MSIPSKQIGQSAEANLLWNISKQLERQTQVISTSGGGGSTFDGQLTQDGDPVSDTNPLPVTFTGTIEAAALSDTTFQDSTGQLFVYRDNGVDTPIAYKIPDWTVYTPIAPVTATSSPLTNYALETGGNLQGINSTLQSNSQNTVSFYTALQDDVVENQYHKNDVISRTDFYRQYNGDYLDTRWDNITQGSTNLNTPDLENLLLQGIEKDTPFSIELAGGETSDPIDVSNISSIGVRSSNSKIIVQGSVDGVNYNVIQVYNSAENRYRGEIQNLHNCSVDVSSFKYIRFENLSSNTTEVSGFLSMLPVTPNGEIALLQEGNSNLIQINTRDSDILFNNSVNSSTPFTVDTLGKGTLAFQTSGTWTGTVIIEASQDGINWLPTTYVAQASGNTSSTFTANTAGQINCVGLPYIRFRSNTISSGQVDIRTTASRLVSNVMLDNPLPAGSNTIGTVNLNGGNTTAVKVDGSAVTQPVSVSSLPLPSGGATSALQTTGNTSIANIDTKTPALVGGKVPVTDPTALPLPTNASTSALQTTGNTSLSNIDTDLGTTSDTPWSGTGNGTLIAIQKAIWNKFLTDTNGNLKINQTATTFTYSPNNSTNGNSSVFALANGSTWNGTIENAINQPYLIFGVVSDRNVTVTVNQYLDAAGTIQDVPPKVFTVTAGTPFSTSVAVLGNYIKLSVSNTSGVSANLYVDSYYGLLPVQADSLTQAGNFKTSVQEQQVITSTLNSSTAQLAASATYTGAWEAVLNTASTQVGVVSDQPVTITISQAIDAAGTKVVSVKTYTRLANQPFGESLLVVGAYQKVTVQNTGASTTTTLAISTIYTPVMNQSPVGPDNSGNMPVGIGQQVYGSTNAVYVGGTSQVQVTPTVTSASAYTAGNVVGGLLTFTNAVNSTVLSGVLESISIAVKSLQTTSFKLYIFKGVPSTTFTDKTAPAIVTGDATNLLDVYSFTTPDNGLGNNVTLYYSDAINRSLVLTNSSLYAVLICLGTPTFTSTTDVIVTASILRD
jgi:hypothetical protein